MYRYKDLQIMNIDSQGFHTYAFLDKEKPDYPNILDFSEGKIKRLFKKIPKEHHQKIQEIMDKYVSGEYRIQWKSGELYYMKNEVYLEQK